MCGFILAREFFNMGIQLASKKFRSSRTVGKCRRVKKIGKQINRRRRCRFVKRIQGDILEEVNWSTQIGSHYRVACFVVSVSSRTRPKKGFLFRPPLYYFFLALLVGLRIFTHGKVASPSRQSSSRHFFPQTSKGRKSREIGCRLL